MTLHEPKYNDDTKLVQRAQAGNEYALRCLIDKHEGRIRHIVRYKVSDHQGFNDYQTVEDLTQETIIKMLKGLPRLRDPASFRSWLGTITINCCKDWLERNLQQAKLLNEAKEEMKAEIWAKFANAYIHEAARNIINSLPLSELSAKRRVALKHSLDGKNYEEIGQLMDNISPNAVGDLLYHARKCVKKNIAMIKETLAGFQLPPTVEQEIMRRIPKEIMRQIPNSSLNSAPTTSKPLEPWVVATSLAVVTLLIGLGIKQATTFQLPYSFDAPESATMVEIVDAPMIEIPLSNLSQINRVGGVNGGEPGNGNQANDSAQKTAADSQSIQKNNIESDTGSWTRTGGPYGGVVGVLHATPDGTLFAGTSGAGMFRSTNGGDTWTLANAGLRVYENDRLPYISVLTQKGNTLYAVTGGDLFSSTNDGDSWQQLAYFQDEMVSISGIAFIGDTIYIGRHKEEGVFCSNDNGKSWTQIGSGLTDRFRPRLIASGTTLFAQMRDHVFRLKVGEKSWTKLTIEDPRTKAPAESDIREFVVSDKMLYAATANGNLFRSTDMGNSWKSIKPKSMQGFYGELAAVGNAVFYISMGGQVFRSTDTGNSWTMLNTDLTNETILSITALSEKILYVGTYNGVFRSMDSGESWTKINTGISNTHNDLLVSFGGALYTVTGDGIVKSADAGNSWVPVNSGLIAGDGLTLAVWRIYLPLVGREGPKLTVSEDKLYAAIIAPGNSGWDPLTSGLYRLAEDGNSWVPIQTNMQSSNGRIGIVYQLANTEETFYIAGAGELHRWRVGEDLWTELELEILHPNQLAVSGRTVYILDIDGTLFRSVDEGDSWADVSLGLPNWKELFIMNDGTLACVGETIYAGIRDEVFRSRDGGKTWRSIVAGLPDGYVEMQLVNGTTLYGTSSHGVFRLAHGSDSWEQIAPTQRDIMSLAYDGTTFYAGTDGEGIFRLSPGK